jgi:hypothetical protein
MNMIEPCKRASGMFTAFGVLGITHLFQNPVRLCFKKCAGALSCFDKMARTVPQSCLTDTMLQRESENGKQVNYTN